MNSNERELFRETFLKARSDNQVWWQECGPTWVCGFLCGFLFFGLLAAAFCVMLRSVCAG